MWPAEEVGNGNAGNQRKHDARIGNRIWQNHVLCIDKDQGGNSRHEYQIEWQRERRTIVPRHDQEEKSSQRLNRRIARRNVCLA